jgi:hypothetical protein
VLPNWLGVCNVLADLSDEVRWFHWAVCQREWNARVLRGLLYRSSGTDACRFASSAVRIPWRISDQLCDGLQGNESCDTTLHVQALPPPPTLVA